MPYYAWAPANNDIYVITGPDGDRAVFNDPSDSDYVGAAEEVTGLDSAEVRESNEERVESDGGSHGDFYYGRRPITMKIKVFGHEDAHVRRTRLSKARVATNAMREDATLAWTPNPAPSFYVPQFVPVRRQQPVRFTGGWNKEANLALVSEITPILGVPTRAVESVAATPSVDAENMGDYPMPPVVKIRGPVTDPVVDVFVTNRAIKFTAGFTIALGQEVTVDVLNHTATWQDGTSANRYLDYITSTWPEVRRGMTTFVLSGTGKTTGTTRLSLVWRDAWV